MMSKGLRLPPFRPFVIQGFQLLPLFWAGVYVLAISQDYIYSELRDTGFYWYETALYNCFWLIFIPISLGIKSLMPKTIYKNSTLYKAFIFTGISLTISILHIILFTSLFTLSSHIFFSPSHRFGAILNSSLSNHLYLAIIAYLCFFFIIGKLKSANKTHSKTSEKIDSLTVKQGNQQIIVSISEIQYFQSHRPYTLLKVDNRKLLTDLSLKALEGKLDAEQFLRIHRSTIINKDYITQFTSRQNGDYDAILKNGDSIRLSRHYRKNWIDLIHHSA